MALLTDFLPDVRPDLPDCLDKIMVDAIRQSAIKFCEETHIVAVNLPLIVLTKDVSEYAIQQTLDHRVMSIKNVFDSKGNRLLHMLGNRMLQPISGAKPSHWSMIDRDTLRLYPIPNVGGDTITIKATVKPSQTSTVIDDILFEDYRIGIAAGAKASLMTMPGKEWTNFDLAGYNKRLFDDMVTDAKMSIATNFSGAPMRVRPVRFV